MKIEVGKYAEVKDIVFAVYDAVNAKNKYMPCMMHYEKSNGDIKITMQRYNGVFDNYLVKRHNNEVNVKKEVKR